MASDRTRSLSTLPKEKCSVKLSSQIIEPEISTLTFNKGNFENIIYFLYINVPHEEKITQFKTKKLTVD